MFLVLRGLLAPGGKRPPPVCVAGDLDWVRLRLFVPYTSRSYLPVPEVLSSQRVTLTQWKIYDWCRNRSTFLSLNVLG